MVSDGSVACGSATAVSVSLTAGSITRKAPVDLMLVIDDSASINPAEFELLRSALLELVQAFTVLFDNGGRVGIVMFEGEFSKWPDVNLYIGRSRTVLAPSTDPSAVIAALQAVRHEGQGTCTSCGLDRATAEFLAADAPDHKRIALVVTDGVSNAVAEQPAPGTPAVAHLRSILQSSIAAAHAAQVEVYAVGVGSVVNPAELAVIADDPDSTHVFEAAGFGELEVSLNETLSAAVVAPEATDAVLTLDVNPEFVVETAAVDAGTVRIEGQRITWRNPTLRESTVTLSYEIRHRVQSRGGDKPLHVAVSYSDMEGNTLDVPSLSVVVFGCDRDGDGVADESDNCAELENADQADLDLDSVGDVCDDDDDGDGQQDAEDNCPLLANPDQRDGDADGEGDLCDADDDADGVPDEDDNCTSLGNARQADADGDGRGEACDDDTDGDTAADDSDNCPAVANPAQEDTDADGIGDACDDDAGSVDTGDDGDVGDGDDADNGNDDDADSDEHGGHSDEADSDEDGDEVPDDDDDCGGTSRGQVVDMHGCAIEQLCPCEDGWNGHHKRMGCVQRAAWAFARAGLLRSCDAPAIVFAAAHRHCGRSH